MNPAMRPDRLRQIEELYHAVRESSADRHAVLLAEADPDIRSEVESLLVHAMRDGVLDRPAVQLPNDANPLTAGAQLGPYRVETQIGKGGMGEVWRAHDPRLNRTVAIKRSAQPFTDRFEREARAVAALNHPNVCQIYDVGPDYLVMEYIEGAPIKGPLPVGLALKYAEQICDALDAAHCRGITHRDLKPANILLSRQGIKLLDFGLAQMGPGADNPTMMALTQTGAVMGTPAYMAPEQREGKPADARSDIYSFGCVLYEMLTGRRVGPERAAVVPPLEGILRTCLEADPDERWQSARELKHALRWAAEAEPATAATSRSRPGTAGWIAAGVFAVISATLAFLHFREKPADQNVMPQLALSIVPASGESLAPVGGLSVDRISPDGSAVLYRAADARFHVRRLSSFQDQILPPFTWYGDPFWAPDSKSIAAPTATGLVKMQAPNGSPELVTAAVISARGGSWGDKGVILVGNGPLFSPGGASLFGIPAAGGKAFPIEVAGLKQGWYYDPEFLPGGNDFLFLFLPQGSAETQLFIATLRGGKAIDARLLVSNDTAAAFTSAGGGRILFVRNDNLYAQRIDVKGRRLIGDIELVQDRVASNPQTRNAYFSVSRSGTLVWRSGTAVISQVTVFDRRGNRTGTAGAAGPAQIISLAPDEAHILVSSEAGSWVMESNGPGRTNFPSAYARLWSLDNAGLFRVEGEEIYQQSVSGSHESRPFAGPFAGLSALGSLGLYGISPDGRRILYSDGTSLLTHSLDGERRPEKVVEEKVDNAAMSPDGAWTVYHPMTESGIYVQPLASPGLRRQIANFGNGAVWRADGKEIMYYGQGRIWSVRVDGVGTHLQFGPPELLFSVPVALGGVSRSRPLAVSRDGTSIYYLQSTKEPDSGVIHVRTRAIR